MIRKQKQITIVINAVVNKDVDIVEFVEKLNNRIKDKTIIDLCIDDIEEYPTESALHIIPSANLLMI